MTLRGRLGPLEERQFRLLFIGQAVSLLGDGMTGVALSFAVLDLTGSVSDLGFVFAARAIPLILFLLVGGVFADRLPRRAVMLTADAVRFTCQGVVAALLISGHAEVWQLIVTQAFYGTATAFFNPASSGLIPMTVSAARLQQANALRGVANATGNVLGPLLAGLLVTATSPGWALAVDSLTFAVSAFFLGRLRLPAQVRLPAKPFVDDLVEGWREFTARTWVWANLIYAGAGNVAASVFTILGAFVAKESLGGAGSWAVIVAGLGLGAVVGNLVALRVRPHRPLVLANLGCALVALPPALIALRAPTAVIAAGAFAGGLGIAFFNPLWETALQRHIPPAVLSRVTAYDWLVSVGLTPVGQMLVGPISAGIGIDTTLWLASAIFVGGAGAVLAVPSVRNLRDDGPTLATETGPLDLPGSGGQVVPEVEQHVVDREGQR
jgi:MFS family permease